MSKKLIYCDVSVTSQLPFSNFWELSAIITLEVTHKAWGIRYSIFQFKGTLVDFLITKHIFIFLSKMCFFIISKVYSLYLSKRDLITLFSILTWILHKGNRIFVMTANRFKCLTFIATLFFLQLLFTLLSSYWRDIYYVFIHLLHKFHFNFDRNLDNLNNTIFS